MQRSIFIAAALAVTAGCGAYTQAHGGGYQTPSGSPPPAATPTPAPAPSASPPPAATPTPPPAATGSADDASATQGGLKLGMVVKDPTGVVVGTITQIGETPDGKPSVLLNVDGKPIGVLASQLKPAGDQAVISMTKAQVKASG